MRGGKREEVGVPYEMAEKRTQSFMGGSKKKGKRKKLYLKI